MENKAYILLTFKDGLYSLMIIDEEGFEFFDFDNYIDALRAKAAWEEFLYEDL